MRKRMQAAHRAVAVSLAGILLVAAQTIHAQNIFGSIVGTVSDATGAVLPKASVTVTNTGTDEKRTATTDGQGNYEVLSLPRGEYKIDVDAGGFKHFSRSPIDVVVDQVARVNVSMANRTRKPNDFGQLSAAHHADRQRVTWPGCGRQGRTDLTVEWTQRACACSAGSRRSSAGRLVNESLGGQNVFAAGNYQIDGGNANQGSILVDGVSTNTSYGNAVELVMDQDVVQEFNAQTHNNTAEFGITPAA